MASSGAVAWLFEESGVSVVDVSDSESDNVAMLAIDAGADDFEAYENPHLDVYRQLTNS